MVLARHHVQRQRAQSQPFVVAIGQIRAFSSIFVPGQLLPILFS